MYHVGQCAWYRRDRRQNVPVAAAAAGARTRRTKAKPLQDAAFDYALPGCPEPLGARYDSNTVRKEANRSLWLERVGSILSLYLHVEIMCRD